jgi:predicted metalloprotease
VVAVALAALVGACGVEGSGDSPAVVGQRRDVPNTDIVGSDIGPTTSSTPPTTAPPPVDVEVIGSDGSDINLVAANAIEDLDVFWSDEFPAVFGDPYEPVGGGFFAIDSGTDPRSLPCGVTDIEQVLNNAFYCPPDDAVAWDQEFLMPDLAAQYGDFTVAVVLAHEWGHAIQARARIEEPTVILELQADCFAGAWVAHVDAGENTRFSLTTEELDLALAGILSLRDAPGSLADDPNAHGSGFDRVGAFQEGFEDGASRCAEYTVGDPSPFQFPFSDGEELTGGDLPFGETVGADGQPAEGIDTLAFESLEVYWSEAFPSISEGVDWEPLEDAVGFDPADPPDCNGTPVEDYRLFLCVPDRFVGFDREETMPQAYEFGDFAVGTLFGTQYGLAVQNQLGLEADSEVQATLWGDCYAGAWAGALLPEEINQQEFPYVLALSPGDLDEGVAVLLSFRTETDRERQGPGFLRVKAYRAGVIRGPQVCADIEAP